MALGRLTLLRADNVQKDLAMTDQQTSDLKKFAEDIREQIGKETRDLRSNFRDLTDAERKAKLTELRGKFEEHQKDIQKKIDDVLDTKQRQRLAELELQLRGTGALFQKDISDALTLTDDQKKKLADLRSEQHTELHKLFQAARTDRDGLHDKLEKARKEADEKLLGVLTTEQHDKLDKLEGKKFEFSPEQLSLVRGGFGSEHGHHGAGGHAHPDAPKSDSPKTDTAKPASTT